METVKQSGPTPVTAGDSKPRSSSGQAANPKQQFLAAVVSMSWQLAIVVLIPVVGGFKLDEHTKSSPLWTIVGFVLAMIGMAIVVQRAVKEVSPPTSKGKTS